MIQRDLLTLREDFSHKILFRNPKKLNKRRSLLEVFRLRTHGHARCAHVEITSRESQPGFTVLHACQSASQRVGL